MIVKQSGQDQSEGAATSSQVPSQSYFSPMDRIPLLLKSPLNPLEPSSAAIASSSPMSPSSIPDTMKEGLSPTSRPISLIKAKKPVITLNKRILSKEDQKNEDQLAQKAQQLVKRENLKRGLKNNPIY